MPKKDYLTLSTGYTECEYIGCKCAATCLQTIIQI